MALTIDFPEVKEITEASVLPENIKRFFLLNDITSVGFQQHQSNIAIPYNKFSGTYCVVIELTDGVKLADSVTMFNSQMGLYQRLEEGKLGYIVLSYQSHYYLLELT